MGVTIDTGLEILKLLLIDVGEKHPILAISLQQSPLL